ncbi:PREDICTED: GPALPP motifs-containing protein 1 [Drosophila arizonae]|uniref:GPALPP motifs-containing protein 1 n=1 Tax=Drosophila arizonae TaxID=7263 RepID=A0ABM1PZ31_DROAR|nr:PREDICTED: GPALPP motifs-containing protein 1 [Drosophila arizonae]
MTSDSSSSSDEEHRRKRKHKKHGKEADKKHKKSKKHKHEKRHKEKKRSNREVSPEKEQLHQELPTRSTEDAAADADANAYMPALPPHLMKQEKPQLEPQPQPTPIIGPVMPSQLAAVEDDSPHKTEAAEDDDDDLAGTFGPLPNATQVELEERALTMKLAALEGGGLGGSTADQELREEWMLELPEVGLKSGLAALNNMKRTFYQGKERPDFSDRSSWTKTPQSAAAGPKPCSSKDLELKAKANYERQRDEEQESIAKKHKKKHKRDESLVELHQKKLRKEQRQREKELAASGSKPERRPFSRDVDLKLNKIDKNQTKQIVDKAKILNTKFSSGQAKYL